MKERKKKELKEKAIEKQRKGEGMSGRMEGREELRKPEL